LSCFLNRPLKCQNGESFCSKSNEISWGFSWSCPAPGAGSGERWGGRWGRNDRLASIPFAVGPSQEKIKTNPSEFSTLSTYCERLNWGFECVVKLFEAVEKMCMKKRRTGRTQICVQDGPEERLRRAERFSQKVEPKDGICSFRPPSLSAFPIFTLICLVVPTFGQLGELKCFGIRCFY
jgi:hypothetical protein